MTQLNDIKLMNETMIAYLKKIGINSQRNEIISNILKDEACFFKMDENDAYIILNDVGVKENINTVYSELISNDVFYDLCKKGKIRENDEEIVIKYKSYDTNNLFKQNKSENNENAITETAVTGYKETFLSKVINRLKSIFKRL